METEGLTDEYIQEHACAQHGCTYWAARGVIYCERHLHGAPSPMPLKVAARKLELEQT